MSTMKQRSVPSIEMLPPLPTVQEVMRFLRVSKSTIHRWQQAGLIEKIPGTNRFRRDEVARFAGELERPRTPEERRRGPYNLQGDNGNTRPNHRGSEMQRGRTVLRPGGKESGSRRDSRET